MDFFAHVITDKVGRSAHAFGGLNHRRDSRGGRLGVARRSKHDFHGTLSYPSINDGLISFFRWYENTDVHKFNIPETPTAELTSIIKEQEERYLKNFGYKAPPFDEELLLMSGYMYLEMKQPSKSLAFFNLAVKYYPKSSDAFDALADYYAEQKKYTKAIENISKAYELSNSHYHLKKLNEFKAKK